MTPRDSAARIVQPVEVVARPEIWLTFAEVAQLVSYQDGVGAISIREVQVRVKEGRYVAHKSDEKGRNGQRIRKIALRSLPEDAQARYIASQSDG